MLSGTAGRDPARAQESPRCWVGAVPVEVLRDRTSSRVVQFVTEHQDCAPAKADLKQSGHDRLHACDFVVLDVSACVGDVARPESGGNMQNGRAMVSHELWMLVPSPAFVA